MHTILQGFQNHPTLMVFVGVFLESAGLPIPGEIVLLTAGALTFSEPTMLPGIILAGTLAAVLGDLILFVVGRKLTEERERRIVGAYCRWTFCTLGSAHCQQQARQLLQRFDNRALLFAKFILGARQFMAPVAGMVGIDPLRFIGFDTVGAFLWVTATTLLGYFARRHLASALQTFTQLHTLAVVVLGLLAVGFIFWKAWKFRRSGAAHL